MRYVDNSYRLIRAAWRAMLARCNNPKSQYFHRYGARGISVCTRWLIFENFYADMGPRPAGMTLERQNNDGNYEPSNCCWATRTQQARNRRSNRMVSIGHETKPVAEWIEHFRISHQTYNTRRCRGWDVVAALSTPPRKYERRAEQ